MDMLNLRYLGSVKSADIMNKNGGKVLSRNYITMFLKNFGSVKYEEILCICLLPPIS